MSGGGDKTEAPTQRRKEKAAEDGNILKSKDFATALVVMARSEEHTSELQ